MKKFQTAAGFLCAIAFIATTQAASIVTVNFDSGSLTLGNASGSILSGGTTADGNGDVLQLGYFSNGTAGSPFAGTWVPLSGSGSLNTAFSTTSIGDANANGAGDGTFALSLTFTAGSSTTGNSFPLAGTPVGIRFYDGLSIATSTHYETIMDSLWKWVDPAVPPTNVPVTISFDDVGLKAESSGGYAPTFAGGKLTTAVATPEPTSALLLGMGAAGLLARRRRY